MTVGKAYSFFFSASWAGLLEGLEDEPGVAVEPVGAGALEAPLEGEPADEEELDPEGGVALLLGLPLAGAGAGRLASSPQPATPSAIVTAIKNGYAFMRPP